MRRTPPLTESTTSIISCHDFTDDFIRWETFTSVPHHANDDGSRDTVQSVQHIEREADGKLGQRQLTARCEAT